MADGKNVASTVFKGLSIALFAVIVVSLVAPMLLPLMVFYGAIRCADAILPYPVPLGGKFDEQGRNMDELEQ